MDDSNQNQNTTPPVATPTPSPTPTTPARAKRGNFAGIFLILLGGLFLIEEIFPFWRFERLWPLILIAIGMWLIYRHNDK